MNRRNRGLMIKLMVISLCILGLTSCHTTKPKTSTLSGTITLQNDTMNPDLDPVDFSGVTVALYHLAVLDTCIYRINSEYPNIGVIINQQTEFDHRLQDTVKTVTTLADGSFKFTGIKTGRYNLVAFKEGWGFRYVYELELEEGDNVFTGKEAIVLYPETIMPAISDAPVIFEPFHVYRFPDNTDLTGALELNENTVLLVAPGKKVDVYNVPVCDIDQSFFWITTDAHIYGTANVDDLDPFYHFKIMDQTTAFSINNLKLDNSVNGLQASNCSQVNVSHSIIRNNSSFALTLFCDSSSMSELLIMNNPYQAVMAYNEVLLEKSVFYNNYDNCMLTEADSEVKNNYIVDCTIGLKPYFGVNNIQYNCFDRNGTAIAVCASDPVITRNNFYQNLEDIEMNRNYIHQYYAYCNPDIQYNNFLGDDIYFTLLGNHVVDSSNSYATVGVNADQLYPNNYFKAAGLTTHIMDKNNPNVLTCPYSVLVQPRSYNYIVPAGIQ